MKLKQVLLRMGRMSRPAWYIFQCSTRLSLALLSIGLLLTLGTPQQVHLANAIYETVEAVLLIGILSSVIVEDQNGKR